MKTKNLAIYQGDTYLFKVALTNEAGEPLQTDGLSFALAVKFPDGATITPELTVDGNIVSLLFPSALTAAITHTTAEYDLRAISGQYVKTYLRGQLHITPSITPVTAGDGGEIHEEAVSVTVSEAAIIPEISLEKDQLAEMIEQGFRKSKNSSIVLVAESEVTGGALGVPHGVGQGLPGGAVQLSA